MASAIWEDSTRFDHAFGIGPWNMESQIHTIVVPYGRSVRSTKDDRDRKKSVSLTEIGAHWGQVESVLQWLSALLLLQATTEAQVVLP